MPISCRRLRRWGTESNCSIRFDRQGYRDFADLNVQLIERVREFQPDVIFCVLMHYEVWFETLDLVRKKSPAAIVNWGTDELVEISTILVLFSAITSICM